MRSPGVDHLIRTTLRLVRGDPRGDMKLI
jgi:hypothetical protein